MQTGGVASGRESKAPPGVGERYFRDRRIGLHGWRRDYRADAGRFTSRVTHWLERSQLQNVPQALMLHWEARETSLYLSAVPAPQASIRNM